MILVPAGRSLVSRFCIRGWISFEVTFWKTGELRWGGDVGREFGFGHFWSVL